MADNKFSCSTFFRKKERKKKKEISARIYRIKAAQAHNTMSQCNAHRIYYYIFEKSPHNLYHVCTVYSFNLIRFHRIHLLSANNMRHFIRWNASLTIPKSTHHKKDNVFISIFFRFHCSCVCWICIFVCWFHFALFLKVYSHSSTVYSLNPFGSDIVFFWFSFTF